MVAEATKGWRRGNVPSLNEAIDTLNLAKAAMNVAPAKAAFSSGCVLLNTIRGSMIGEADYIRLGLIYVEACEALDRGIDQGQAGSLSQSVLGGIEKLTRTAIEIQRNIVKQGKRSVLSRIFHPKKDKEMIDSWSSDLDELILLFNNELIPKAPTANMPQSVVKAQATGSDLPPDSLIAETSLQATPNGVSNADDIVPERLGNVTNTHPDSHDESGDPSRVTKGTEKHIKVNDQEIQTPGPHTSAQEPQNLAGITDTGGSSLPPKASERPEISHDDRDDRRNQEVNYWNSFSSGMGDTIGRIRETVDRWTQERAVRMALGGDVSRNERMYQAVSNLLAISENPSGPVTEFDLIQIAQAQAECLAIMRHDNDDQMEKAIAESLAMATAVEEVEEELPSEVLLRQDNRPAVIRTLDPRFAHVGQLWQALYHVPQVRHRISKYRKPLSPEGAVGTDHPTGGIEGLVWSVHELFNFMELSGLAIVTGEPSMERFPLRPWEGTMSPRGDVESAYKDLSERVEICLNSGHATQRPDWTGLFHSRMNNPTSKERPVFDTKNDFCFLSVEYDDEDEPSDLVRWLTSRVFPKFPKHGSSNSERTATIEAADLIAFSLVRDEVPPCQQETTQISQERRKFSFPESFCLDPFATTSQGLILDTSVAEAIERSTSTEGSVIKTQDEIAHVTAETEATESPAEQPGSESQSLSSKGFQLEKYDLRAVLMHDGLKGRTHVYSYVNHDGAWWKIVDFTVTQVTLEGVLNDHNGLHLGAGPFFLIYSRSLTGPLPSEWPDASEATFDSNPVPPESESGSLYAD